MPRATVSMTRQCVEVFANCPEERECCYLMAAQGRPAACPHFLRVETIDWQVVVMCDLDEEGFSDS